MLQRLLGRAGMASMSAVIMCSIFGALNSNLLYAPRVTFAMGRDGVFFRELGRVHATYRTPVVAIVVHAAMAAGLVAAVSWGRYLVRDLAASEVTGEFARRIVASLQGGTTFDVLTNCVVFSASILYLLSVLAVVVLRVRQPDGRRRYRAWGYPLTPLVFVAVYAWFLRTRSAWLRPAPGSSLSSALSPSVRTRRPSATACVGRRRRSGPCRSFDRTC